MGDEYMGDRRQSDAISAMLLASRLEGMVTAMSGTLALHLGDCTRRTEEASRHRAEFRAEVGAQMTAFSNKSDQQHTENRRFNSTLLWAGISGMASIILLLLGVGGYLFVKANNW